MSSPDQDEPPRNRKRRVRRALLVVVGLVVAVFAVKGFRSWRHGTITGGQLPAEPFRIAGNFYYVGANDVASFLITGPQGHVLIDGGYPGTAPMIMASVAKLGFDIKDVKVLLNSEPHYDHAGGLAELQKASGAQLWASGESARVLEAGGDDADIFFPVRALIWTGIARYPAPRVDHVVKDGEVVRVGPIEATAHITGGHTRGCTSWSFPVRDEDRTLNVVSACSLVVLQTMQYDGYRDDMERTFRLLRSLPVDIWVTSHARLFGRYRKYTELRAGTTASNPFVDPAGYRAYVDSGESQFRRRVTH